MNKAQPTQFILSNPSSLSWKPWAYSSLKQAILMTLISSMILAGCSTANQETEVRPRLPQPPSIGSSSNNLKPIQTAVTENPGHFSLEDRMLLSGTLPESTPDPAPSLGPLYSFRAQDLPLIDALALFARSNQLNIVAGPEIIGTVTVDFHNLPLERAMSALLEAHGYYWEEEDSLIRVKQFKTALFNVDYIRLVRGGTGQNQAKMSSGSSTGGGSQETGQITVNQQDEIKFWEELEKQIQTLMSADGRMVANRLSGTIHVTDWYQRVHEIEEFLDKVHKALYRQVEIEARIYEVNLNDNYSLGINWNEIKFDGDAGTFSLSNIIGVDSPTQIIGAPFGGFIPKVATTAISFASGDFAGILEALREQGELKVISQPRVVTLNNQPALIKVATDQPFFTQTVTQGTSGTGNIVTEEAQSVTIGLVLSVTPQISEDGWVMLDVTPIISRLRDVVISPQGTSNAPLMDVKQSSGLVRLKDGEMVIIGGLIQEETSETERKVPLLGDIPWLGRLFKGTYTVKTKSELVIFLSPKIVKP